MTASQSCKFIFVSGGVLSSLGKGVAAASMGALLESRGLKVTLLKFDPYINIDPGLMSPHQHGEVFVTDDGTECDLDLGHYERYTKAKMGRQNNITSGRIYYNVIQKERAGGYGGVTVQVIPHITDEIKNAIRDSVFDNDVVIIEIGGTVGDIEGLPFLEAARQFKLEEDRENVVFVHLTLVPYIKTSGEVKTKPSQHSVATLRGIGIQPDILICRTEVDLNDGLKDKLSLFCNVEKKAVISAPDMKEVYELPLKFHQEGLDKQIVNKLNMWTRQPDLTAWNNLVKRLKSPEKTVEIGLLDEGVDFQESYKSLLEAFIHSGASHKAQVNITYLDGDKGLLALKGKKFDGFVVPNGFVENGLEGKIEIMEFIRKSNLPCLALGTGFQIMMIEAARNLASLKKANSLEFEPLTEIPLFNLPPKWFNSRIKEWEIRGKNGASYEFARKGSYPCQIKPNSFLAKIYQKDLVWERHRIKGEFNKNYLDDLSKVGFVFSAMSPDNELVEAVEFKGHPFYIGCQFQPEFLSRPMDAHPLINAFLNCVLTAMPLKQDEQSEAKKD